SAGAGFRAATAWTIGEARTMTSPTRLPAWSTKCWAAAGASPRKSSTWGMGRSTLAGSDARRERAGGTRMHPIERAALHEAAHAPLCHLSPEIPQMRALVASADRPGSGEVLMGGPTADEAASTPESLYAWMRMLFAGPLSEAIATG